MDSYPHIENPPESESEWFEALISLARYLRTPQGCPWDRARRAAGFPLFLPAQAGEPAERVRRGQDAVKRRRKWACLSRSDATYAVVNAR